MIRGENMRGKKENMGRKALQYFPNRLNADKGSVSEADANTLYQERNEGGGACRQKAI